MSPDLTSLDPSFDHLEAPNRGHVEKSHDGQNMVPRISREGLNRGNDPLRAETLCELDSTSRSTCRLR